MSIASMSETTKPSRSDLKEGDLPLPKKAPRVDLGGAVRQPSLSEPAAPEVVFTGSDAADRYARRERFRMEILNRGPVNPRMAKSLGHESVAAVKLLPED